VILGHSNGMNREIRLPIHTIVRDGRVGSGPDSGHPVLFEIEADRIYQQGDKIQLPDGSEGEAIGGNWNLEGDRLTQTVYVGEPWWEALERGEINDS
jgi:hypothetical protein